jgi:Bacterial extracellular solute-binding proteins, family 5 Middle
VNALRGHLAEFGVIAPQGLRNVGKLIAIVRDERDARLPVLMALNQEDYMRAYVGSDDAMWKPLPSYFTPGSALYNEEGGDVLKGRRNLDVAKRLLAESGYRGEPVTSMAAQDIGAHKAWGDVTADLLTRLGVKVDYAAVDWRRLAKVAGRFSTPTGTGSTASTRPAGSFAPTATRHFSGGRTTRKSKPRSPPGTRPRHSMRKERLRVG